MIPDSCLDFFQKEDIQRYIKMCMRPIVRIIYNEIYPYIWFICIYNIFLIFLTLANLVIIIWIRNLLKYGQVSKSTND
jgi:cytochrome c oxidase assembly factor CtaG